MKVWLCEYWDAGDFMNDIDPYIIETKIFDSEEKANLFKKEHPDFRDGSFWSDISEYEVE